VTFYPFEMEKMMSVWETDVDYNISESGVHPMSLKELLGSEARVEDLLDLELGYPHVNGIPLLRERIAALYGHGASPEGVLVTVGCAEALYITIQTVTSPGDDVAIMVPNYMHAWGTAKNLGLQIGEFHLRPDAGWALDVDELNSVVTDRTRLIAVCNPNNPTGYVMSETEMDAVVAAAERSGAWLLCDEVYSGGERTTETQTPSFWGRYDKVLALNSLSKAYALPGLRTGWVVGPPETVDDIWRRHEYTTLSVTMLANHLAAHALSPEVRPRILERTRSRVRRGWSILEAWIEEQGWSATPPDAAAIAMVKYDMDVNSTTFVDRLIREKSTLIVPGDHFAMDGWLRLSFGPPEEYLKAGLGRIRELADQLR